MMDCSNDIYQEFQDITGLTDVNQVQYWLEMSDFNLDSAVELFYSSDSHQMPVLGSALRPNQVVSNPSSRPKYYEEDNEEVMRKPDRVKRSRLVSNELEGMIIALLTLSLTNNL
jgi:hypothetical protein